MINIPNTVKMVVLICGVSFAYQMTRCGESHVTPVLIESRIHTGHIYLGCSSDILPDFDENEMQVYLCVNFDVDDIARV